MRKKIFIITFLVLALCLAIFSSCDNKLTENDDHEHQYVAGKEEATCTKAGLEYEYCRVCQVKKEDTIKVLPAKGHDPSRWQLQAEGPCTTSKIEEKICKRPGCNTVIETMVHEVEGHKPGEWQIKIQPTCTVNKVEEKYCLICNDVVETKIHEVTGHEPGEWQVISDATCSQGKVEGKICVKCGYVTESKVGSKLVHDYVSITVRGTCSVSEHVLNTCRLCGDSYRNNYTDTYEPHTEGIWIVERAATCTSEGVRKKICGVCSAVLDEAEAIAMDPNNHSFKVETFPPEGEEEGYVLHTCNHCGYQIVNVYESNLLPSQIYEMIASATVRIEACNKEGKMHSLGSGFFISDKGEIVTNFHVISGAYSLKVKLYGGEEYDVVQVKGINIASDVAVLKIDLEGNSYLKLSEEAVETGDPVYVLGSPLGVDDIFSSGVVSNPNKSVNGKPCIAFSAPISTGNSGGPLVNSRGEVIGINTLTAEKGQNLNFAVRIKEVIDLDKTGEKTVYETYIENLNVGGYNALVYHLLLNYDYMDTDGRYVISSVIREENVSTGHAGRNFELIYDADKKQITAGVVWISNGVRLYCIEMVIDSISTSYEIRFYDHLWSQYTMDGKVSTGVQPIDKNGNLDSSVYNKIITFSNIIYNSKGSGNTLTQANAKSLVGIAYIHILQELTEVFDSS